MLVLSRKAGEALLIGENVRLQVVEIRGDKVRLGIEAPREVVVHREEVVKAGWQPELHGRGDVRRSDNETST